MKTLVAVLLLSISSLAMGLEAQPNRTWSQAPQPYQQHQYQQYQQQPYQQQQQMGIPSIQNGRLIYSH